jgi:lipopolysaccharide export system permease protein
MKILTLYLLRRFFKYYLFVLLLISVFLLVTQFIDTLDVFMSSKSPSWGRFMLYLLLRLPLWLTQLFPFITILASLFTFWEFTKNNELVAIKSAGVDLLHFSLPLLYAGVLLSVAIFVFSEYVSMPFTKASNKIYAYEITSSCGSRSATSQELEVLHNVSFLLPKNNVIFISSFDRARYSGKNFIIESYSGENKLERRVYAEKGYFKDNELILENVVVHKFSDDRVSMEALPQEKYSVPSLQKYGQQLSLLFDTTEVKLEEMNFAELRKRIKLLELYGRGNIKEKINYYLRFAYPMLNFVFILFSIPVGLTYRVKGLRNVGLGVLVSFFWWGLSSVMSAFAEKGSVHPITSAFLPDAVFLVISIIMIKKVLRR